MQPSNCEGVPDITIIYQDKIFAKKITLIGMDAGFDETNFYVLVKNIHITKAIIPFDKIGENREIICEKEIVNILLLNYLILLSFFNKNWIVVRSSAFVFDGRGTLILCWLQICFPG
jgi:hypothetical protein